MVKLILSNWGFMRILRLGLGIYIAIQAIQTQSILTGGIAAFFLFQAITNTGCCGASGCTTPIRKADTNATEEISYEEVK